MFGIDNRQLPSMAALLPKCRPNLAAAVDQTLVFASQRMVLKVEKSDLGIIGRDEDLMAIG